MSRIEEKYTSELREDLQSMKNVLAADRTGRTAELERGISRIENELERRKQWTT